MKPGDIAVLLTALTGILALLHTWYSTRKTIINQEEVRQIEAKRADRKDLVEEVSKLWTQNASLQTRNEVLETENCQLRADLDTLRHNYSTVQAELEKWTSRMSDQRAVVSAREELNVGRDSSPQGDR